MVEVKQVDLAEQMIRAIARQAEAERERRAKIIHAEGEYTAAEKLAMAAEVIQKQPAAIQLRYLQTLVEIGTEKNTTIVFPAAARYNFIFGARAGSRGASDGTAAGARHNRLRRTCEINETGEFELVVGNRQLLSGFFIVVLLFGGGLRHGVRRGAELAALGVQTLRPHRLQSRRSPADRAAARRRSAAIRAPQQAHRSRPVRGHAGDSRRQRSPQRRAETAAATAQPAARASPPRAQAAARRTPRGRGRSEAAAGLLLAGDGGQARPRRRGRGSTRSRTRVSRRCCSPGPNNLMRVLVGPYTDTAALGKAKAGPGKRRIPSHRAKIARERFRWSRSARPRAPPAPRLPEWARKSRTHFESLNRLKSGLRRLNLHTVCESARCPNIHECFHRGAATFMILGNRCTRGCGFCSVPKGSIRRQQDMRLDPAEPANVARMAARDEAALRGDHQRESRRSGGRRLAPLRRDRARGAARAAGGARGSADAGFLRRSRRRGARARRRPARLQSQHGDGAAALPRGCARRRTTGSRSTCWPSRARYRRRRADQIRLHGGAGRDRGGSARAAARSARGRRGRGHHRPVPAAHAAQSAGGGVHRAARSSTRIAITAFRSASRWCSAARWCAAPTWRTR